MNNETYSINKITIYTPTYNRAYCLGQLYESLCKQNNENFEWLIVDDGSTDNTEDLVQCWIDDNRFKVTYYKQQNEGKMAKLNFIHAHIDTELCVCVDSDDYLVNDAVNKVLAKWENIKDKSDIAGMVGLDIFKNGKVVGKPFPENLKKIKYCNFKKFDVEGDKKFIYRTEILKNYPPYPSFGGEKFPAPGYLYRLIDVDYDLYIINDALCVVEYLDDGLSKNKFKQFKNSPNSFMFYRHERMRLASDFAERYRNAIHYVSSAIFAKKSFFKKNHFPIITLVAVPVGLLLNFYIRYTNKQGVVN